MESSYEGQRVSAVELVGRPDIDESALKELLVQQAGQPFSPAQVNAGLAALKATGKFQDVQLDMVPESNGVRVRFVLQPALYVGMYEFPGTAKVFSYSRLLQVSNYQSQAPYSESDLRQAESTLTKFFQSTGFFLAKVRHEALLDPAHGLVNINFSVDLNRRAKIGQVIVEGATPAETSRLQKSLRSLMARIRGAYLKTGKTYRLENMQSATMYLQRELGKDRHLTAQVRLVGANYHPETNLADVVFHVAPGPQIRITVAGAHLWRRTKQKLIPIYQENLFNDELVQEGERTLTSYFQSKGYFEAKVETKVDRQPSDIAVSYQVEKGPRGRVTTVNISGNQHFPERQLLATLAVKRGRFLSHGEYSDQLVRKSAEAIEGVYRGAGYSQVKVTPRAKTDNKNRAISFLVQEGPQDIVESLRLVGNNTLPEQQLAPKGLKLAPGRPYSAQLVQQDRNQILGRYLALGYLTVNFRATATQVEHDPHRLAVTYAIAEGPKVEIAQVVTVGSHHARQSLISKIANIKSGRPLSQNDLFASESSLYNLGIFDWAEVDPKQPVTTQSQSDVVIKVHESARNSTTYGFGFEVINRGGSVPSGTVAVPGLPPIGLPSTFKTSETTFYGPRGSVEYTRRDLRGTAESFSASGLAGRLDQRGTLTYSIPAFRGSSWTASTIGSGENSGENPIYTAQLGQGGLQFQKPLDAKRTKNVILRYSFKYTSISNLLIPALVPEQDRSVHLSGFSASYARDTRDSVLDAHRGIYQSFEVGLNSSALGSSADFAHLLGQMSYFHNVGHGIVWANSVRLGLQPPFNGSFVPLSEEYFTGGGSTLRGFPLNGAGPQQKIPACGDPNNPATCSFITVPVGGYQLFIVNTEFRIPTPFILKNLGIAAFYDGGNVYRRISLHNLFSGQCNLPPTTASSTTNAGTTDCFTSSIGAGLRYATPVGPVRIDLGHNLNGIAGIKSTQIFVTLGQAF